MAQPKNLQGAKDRQDNEFYTLYSSVEYVFNNVDGLKEYVKDKIIYLPCDTEDSNIYKYLINNKEELKIKEILHTSDDYYMHHDLYRKADIVITNTPFTKICKWILFLYEMNKEFIIWAPFTVFQFASLSKYIINDELKVICYGTEISNFLRPDGKIKRATDTYILSNISYLHNVSKKLVLNSRNTLEYLKQNNKIVYYKDIPILKRITDFPCDYNGPIYISFAALLKYKTEFEIFNFVSFRYNVEGILRKDCFKVFLRDDKYFRNINEWQFRCLYAVQKNETEAKLEDYIKEEKINKLF